MLVVLFRLLRDDSSLFVLALFSTDGIFLLLSFLAWLRRRQALFMLLPLLIFSLLVWGDRVLWPEGLNCGSDDDFLCIPDRWPWSIDYVIR